MFCCDLTPASKHRLPHKFCSVQIPGSINTMREECAAAFFRSSRQKPNGHFYTTLDCKSSKYTYG